MFVFKVQTTKDRPLNSPKEDQEILASATTLHVCEVSTYVSGVALMFQTYYQCLNHLPGRH
jgi:hypothetical protein